MKVITIAQLKGGAAKSTTAAAIAQAAKTDGLRVLCVDLDAQHNLTYFLGGNHKAPGAFELLNNGLPTLEAIQETKQGIELIPGSQALATLKTGDASARRLQRALSRSNIGGRQYDLVIIDTGASLSEAHYNALQASDGLLIPMEVDLNNIAGLHELAALAGKMKESNPKLEILGSILTRFDGRSKINRRLRQILEERAEKAGAPILMAIRQGIVIKEAQSLQENLFSYDQKSKPALDYAELYQIIKQREDL